MWKKRVVKKLMTQNFTISVAESFTGGYFSHQLTSIPGISKIFKGSIVVYSLESKNKFFGIPWNTLNCTKGVSKEIAKILACNIKKIFNTDIGISFVGFAGPTSRKGVKMGTVYLGLSTKSNSVIVEKMLLPGQRESIIKKSAQLMFKLIDKNV